MNNISLLNLCIEKYDIFKENFLVFTVVISHKNLRKLKVYLTNLRINDTQCILYLAFRTKIKYIN